MAAANIRNLELEARALLGSDEDDRRVYADWLQSVGDPRGELISLELHADSAYRAQKQAVRAELDERLTEYRASWEAWASERGLEVGKVRFSRGFVVDLEVGLGPLSDSLEALFAREPIQRLTITEADDEGLAALSEAQPDALARLRYLKVAGELGPEATRGLALVPFGRLGRLNLLGTELTSEACEGLARLGAPKLEALTLTANAIDDAGLELLLQNSGRSSWRELYLAGNPLAAASLERLATDTELRALESLHLRGIDAKFNEFEALLRPGALPACTRLELSSWGSWRERELRTRLEARFPRLKLR